LVLFLDVDYQLEGCKEATFSRITTLGSALLHRKNFVNKKFQEEPHRPTDEPVKEMVRGEAEPSAALPP